MITVGIIGGSGYVAGELIRCLLVHPDVEITFIYSHSSAGLAVSELHPDLFHCELKLTQEIDQNVAVVFLCLGHGNSTQFLTQNPFSSTTK
ncbi:MAG: N-acetyl-gamma-glutamyl-phosphate reductase, partial [Flavobacteriales bacterium]|nr:N-acetyl-gamma-glutamyl-phosphate reductase [Flavobacteriales bacterium]